MPSPNRPRRLLPLFVATALTLLTLDLAGFEPISGLRRTILTVGQPVAVMLAVVVAPISATWNGAVHFDDVEEENRVLRRRVAELEGDIAAGPDVEAELRAVLAATEIDYLGDVDRVAARVVVDRRDGLRQAVEIDKGTEHGIGEGMPVVTGRGLVGVVELASGDRAVVRLISDVDTAVGVRSRHGLGLVGGGHDGVLRLDLTPGLAESVRLGAAIEGERFVTSGVDRSLFPPGIPVGTLLVIEGPARSPLSPVPAGPVTGPDAAGGEGAVGFEADGSVYDAVEIEVALRPLAELDRLGYVTVLLAEPSG